MLVALNLRAPITSVPPLLLTIATDLHLSGAAAGLLTALPVLCMGLFAPVGQWMAHAVGREQAAAWALGLVLVGTFGRLGGGVAPVLYLATFLAGVGIAIAGTVLPGIIAEHFAARSGLLTGIWMAGMMAGAAAAAQFAVPLADLLSSWQASLASWSVLALVALIGWLPVTAHARRRAERVPRTGRPGLPWRSATAWLLAAYLVCNSWQFYTQVSWIPATYESLGRPATVAAALLTIFTVAQAFTGVGAPALADRIRDSRWLLAPSVLLGLVGSAGVAWRPEAAPVLWVVLLGLGLGGGFSLGLLLLVRYGRTPAASAGLTAMVFLVAYTLAAVGPVSFGWLRDASGGTRLPWALLAAVAAVQLLLVAGLSPDRRRVG